MSVDKLRFQDAHEYEEFQPSYYEQQVQPVQTDDEQNQNISEPNPNSQLTGEYIEIAHKGYTNKCLIDTGSTIKNVQ